MSVRIDWRGREVKARIRAATARTVDERAREATTSARQIHPGWTSRTGAAERSIEALTGHGLRAAISFAVRPLWFLERGWIHHESGDHTIERAVNAKFRDLVYRVRDAIHAR